MKENTRIRQEMSEIQEELQSALQELLKEVGKKLPDKDRRQIEGEFAEIREMLERLKTGLVWVAVFGKTSVGKSSVVNSLMGEDIAKVAIAHNVTLEATEYKKDPWMIVDVPGIMGTDLLEETAFEEAKKAHGIIFVIDGEPYQDEIELFDRVQDTMPNIPKIVFVNQWDKSNNMPKWDRESVQAAIVKKMSPYISTPDDIVYGSARLYDPEQDMMVRQDLPQLLDRMYEGAGTLAQVMGILDPANRAADLSESLREKVITIRLQAARRVITISAIASTVSGFLPFAQLLMTPGILGGMVYMLFRVMGRKEDRASTRKITMELLKACAQELGVEFAANVVAEIAINAVSVTGIPGLLFGVLGSAAGLSYFRYRRTAILGEVTLEYIRNDCSWGGEGRHAAILHAKERAGHYYHLLSKQGARV